MWYVRLAKPQISLYSLIRAFASRLNILSILSYLPNILGLIGGCTGLSGSIHVKMPLCWKSHVVAYIVFHRNASSE